MTINQSIIQSKFRDQIEIISFNSLPLQPNPLDSLVLIFSGVAYYSCLGLEFSSPWLLREGNLRSRDQNAVQVKLSTVQVMHLSGGPSPSRARQSSFLSQHGKKTEEALG